MPSRFLHNETDLDAALAILTAGDVRLARLIEVAGRPALRRRPAGFPGLCAIICSQQLSTASAAAIWGRLAASFAPFHHDAIRQARSARLCAARTFQAEDQDPQGDQRRHRQRCDRSRGACRHGGCTKPMPRSPHCMASSVHGLPTSISCSVWVMRTPGPPATRPARGRAPGIRLEAAHRQGHGQARGGMAALARSGGPHAVELLSRHQTARSRAGSSTNSLGARHCVARGRRDGYRKRARQWCPYE